MSNKQRVIYDNYYSDELFECARENLIEQHLEEASDNENWEPSVPEIWDQYYFYLENDWDTTKDELENFFNNETFILQGSIGRWNGSAKGGFIFNSFNELYKAWEECQYIKIYDEDGHFYIKCSHHDGNNFYEVRKLNEKGKKFYDRHYDDYTVRELHDALMKDEYSCLPNFARDVYGCE